MSILKRIHFFFLETLADECQNNTKFNWLHKSYGQRLSLIKLQSFSSRPEPCSLSLAILYHPTVARILPNQFRENSLPSISDNSSSLPFSICEKIERIYWFLASPPRCPRFWAQASETLTISQAFRALGASLVQYFVFNPRS